MDPEICEYYIENIEDIRFLYNQREKSPTEMKAGSLVTKADLIIEVSHPKIVNVHLATLLSFADIMVGSPTAFALPEAASVLKSFSGLNNNGSDKAENRYHTLYIPSGALWGANDIQKMADGGSLKKLTITMKKHPSSFKFTCEKMIKAANECLASGKESILFDGNVQDLCPKAPNNVNTMAAAAIAAHNLGFDGVGAVLIADPNLDSHIVEVEATGPGENPLIVKTIRTNFAKTGAVTGTATFASFSASMIRAVGFPSSVVLV
eukprot:Sdes_comp16261_c0_seq3m5559